MIVKRNSDARLIIDNNGFSLLELIVTIAIVVTLSGLLIPQFTRYTKEKKETACVENREAVVNICEKLVYGRAVPLSTLSGVTLTETNIAALPSTISEVEKEALKRHCECPDHGVMTITVTDGIVHCVCNSPEHSADVAVDMTTWTGSGLVTIDPHFDTPSGSYTPPGPGPEDPPEDPPNDEEDNPDYLSSYWPYPEDPRWNDIDSSGDAFIEVNVPSGLFPVRTAGGSTIYFCAINRYGSADGKLKIYKSKAGDPMYYLCGSESEAVIVTNGLNYNKDTLIEAATANRTMWVDVGTQDGQIDRGDHFWISGGTIYTCSESGRRYIAFHQGLEEVDLPPENCTANNFGNWYYVGATDQTR